jgi:hypothetical protein
MEKQFFPEAVLIGDGPKNTLLKFIIRPKGLLPLENSASIILQQKTLH